MQAVLKIFSACAVVLQIDDSGQLRGLPVLIDGYAPDLARLPDFVLRLSRDVEWEQEKACFRTVAEVGCCAEGGHASQGEIGSCHFPDIGSHDQACWISLEKETTSDCVLPGKGNNSLV